MPKLCLGEAATEALFVTRSKFSRLHYAPSKKTILRAILAALPELCVRGPNILKEIENHKIWKPRETFTISEKESRVVSGDLFSISLKKHDISIVVDYLLSVTPTTDGFDLCGSILKYLSGRQYLRGKSVLIFRLPGCLEEQILPAIPSRRPRGVDEWECRYTDLSREHQNGLQEQLGRLFGKAASERPWPPAWGKQGECQRDARDLIEKSLAANVVSVLLKEEDLKEIRKMSRDNVETAAIATLLWCEKRDWFHPAEV